MSTSGSKDYADDAPPTGRAMPIIAYEAKYGLRDWRGGGRASARETAARVAAGAVARLVIPEVDDPARRRSRSAASAIERSRWRGELVERGARGGQLARRGRRMRRDRRAGRLGRAGLRQARRRARRGDDVDQRGQGRRDRRRLRRGAAARRGECRPMRRRDGRLANHAGGIAGLDGSRSWSASRSSRPRRSCVGRSTRRGRSHKGRHDPCVGIRGAPVVEAMMALVLADQKLLHRAQCGTETSRRLRRPRPGAGRLVSRLGGRARPGRSASTAGCATAATAASRFCRRRDRRRRRCAFDRALPRGPRPAGRAVDAGSTSEDERIEARLVTTGISSSEPSG